MFSQLKTKLTLAYGGLLGLILLVISMAVYVSVENTAKHKIAEEMRATSAVYARLWDLKAEQLEESTLLLSKDFGFREAAATSDVPTIESALNNISGRINVDMSVFVSLSGDIVGAGDVNSASVPADVVGAIESQGAATGVIQLDGVHYQVVSQPVKAPASIGWILFGSRLDGSRISELEELSAIPLTATVMSSEGIAGVRDGSKGEVIRDTRINGFGGLPDAHLILRYPIAGAMAPFHSMLLVLFIVTVGGIVALLVCSWFISRSVTQPISKLDRATRALADGRRMPIDVRSQDEIGRLAHSFTRMAEQIESREENIVRLSLTDTESDLPNRRSLQKGLDDTCGAEGEHVYCGVVSPARFAKIMAVIGQQASNRLVAALGNRMQALPDVRAIGRLGSDLIGFVLLADNDEQAASKIQTLLRAVSDSIEVDGEMVDIQLAAGYAPFSAAERLGLIDRAVIALQQGRERHATVFKFDREAYGDPSGTLSLMSEMIAGLSDGSIYMTYQPKVDLRTQTITSVEALLRWEHPVRGFISPEEFVRTAEETGHIRPLSEWVLHSVNADRQAFMEAGFDLKIAVNLSGRLLTDTEFLNWSIGMVGNEASRYCFEVTETAVIDDPALALGNIEKLREAGIEISIDDYGSGLSSLSYLKQIPAQELKIDKSFVIPLSVGTSDALLIKSTIDLAHSLGMKVTAEGVESAEVLAMLSGMGADSAQGYFISRPVKHDAILNFLQEFLNSSAASPEKKISRAV